MKNPVDPTLTTYGKELAREIAAVLERIDRVSSTNVRAFSVAQKQASNRERSISGLCSIGGDSDSNVGGIIEEGCTNRVA